jgi:hypothetical protein
MTMPPAGPGERHRWAAPELSSWLTLLTKGTFLPQVGGGEVDGDPPLGEDGSPLFLTAARTRSLASCTASSGSPTMLKAGSPGPMSTSTSTREPSRPTTAKGQRLREHASPPSATRKQPWHTASRHLPVSKAARSWTGEGGQSEARTADLEHWASASVAFEKTAKQQSPHETPALVPACVKPRSAGLGAASGPLCDEPHISSMQAATARRAEQREYWGGTTKRAVGTAPDREGRRAEMTPYDLSLPKDLYRERLREARADHLAARVARTSRQDVRRSLLRDVASWLSVLPVNTRISALRGRHA